MTTFPNQNALANAVANAAEQKIAREIGRRSGTSIFDGRGQLNQQSAGTLSHDGQVYLGEYLDLSGVPWAPAPDGYEHSSNLARLVEHMAALPSGEGGTLDQGGVVGCPLSMEDQKVLHAVAMLYCVGRGALGENQPPIGIQGYERRSAEFADRYLRGEAARNTIWSKQNIREDVCRLILKHTDERAINEDKRLQVFADACRFELVRHGVNTPEGLSMLRTHAWKKPELFHGGFAKDATNFRAWMITRGWK